ncbi:Hypothetical protein CINCED_3A022601, partial [Cinara cedri]
SGIEKSQDSLLDMKQKMCTMMMKWAFFFKGIPTESLVLKSESCSGGKKAKDHITVLICGNMAGEIRKPLEGLKNNSVLRA